MWKVAENWYSQRRSYLILRFHRFPPLLTGRNRPLLFLWIFEYFFLLSQFFFTFNNSRVREVWRCIGLTNSSSVDLTMISTLIAIVLTLFMEMKVNTTHIRYVQLNYAISESLLTFFTLAEMQPRILFFAP